jgi:hypothetical protein
MVLAPLSRSHTRTARLPKREATNAVAFLATKRLSFFDFEARETGLPHSSFFSPSAEVGRRLEQNPATQTRSGAPEVARAERTRRSRMRIVAGCTGRGVLINRRSLAPPPRVPRENSHQ